MKWSCGLAVALMLPCSSAVRSQAPDQAVQWQVAITIDDLPLTGGDCRSDEVLAVNDSLLQILGRFDVPATGFVVPGTPCQGEGPAEAIPVARRWLAAGHTIGNHSHTHPDYNRISVTGYLADLDRAHVALAALLETSGQRERWFRAPQLHMGSSAIKASELNGWMNARGYRNGVVTIDNQEWVFAAAYLRHRQDSATAQRITTAYLDHLEAAIRYARSLSRQLFGREIPQVLLLHANRINADHLDAVLEMIRASGGAFVSLAQATADPAYHADRAAYVGPQGLSWLLRWAAAGNIAVAPEPREPAWIGRLATGS